MKPKKPQECWMPMEKKWEYLWSWWPRNSRNELLDSFGGVSGLTQRGLIPVKVQLIPVKTKKRKK